MNHIEKLPTSVYGMTANVAKCAHFEWSAEEAVALDADGVMTSKASKTTKQTITENLVSPATPRALEVVVGGTAGDVKAGNVVVSGTNIAGLHISESFALTADTTETIAGVKAFKTVEKVEIPAQDGTGATFTVGWINALGIPCAFSEKPLAFALFEGTRETTDPTIVIDAADVEKNTIALNSALAGKKVDVFMFY